jgi:hypothetical protein
LSNQSWGNYTPPERYTHSKDNYDHARDGLNDDKDVAISVDKIDRGLYYFGVTSYRGQIPNGKVFMDYLDQLTTPQGVVFYFCLFEIKAWRAEDSGLGLSS